MTAVGFPPLRLSLEGEVKEQPDQAFSLGWPVSRSDARDDLQRLLKDSAFLADYRLPGGQFALCRRDETTGCVAALRDPSATIPMHAHFDGRDWLVSSSIAALESRLKRQLPIRLAVLKELHRTLRLACDQSLYEETMMLAPGYVYLFGPGPRVRRHQVPIEWPPIDLADREQWGSADLLASELVDQVRTSVTDAADHRASTVQFSGGLDSNLILHAGVRSGVDLSAIGMTFSDLDCDESAEMNASCRMLGMAAESVDYGGKSYEDWRDTLFSEAEYVPFTTAFMALEVARKMTARRGRVLLNGLGGDEIFDTRPAAAAGFLARLLGYRVPLRLSRRNPRAVLSGLLRHALHGRAFGLGPFLRSGSAHFQMALLQRLSAEGVDYRMPFCDWRIIVRARVLNALYCASTSDSRRTIQRALLDHFSPQVSQVVGLRKPRFNAIGFAEDRPPIELGPTIAPRFRSLVPDFVEFKRLAGRRIR